MTNDETLARLDRLERKLDMAILMSTGMTQAEAETELQRLREGL